VPWAILIRDAAVLSATLELWRLANAWQAAAPTWTSAALGVLAGVLLSLVWGYAVHEWGHLIGSWMVRARVQPSHDPRALKLFDFVATENSPAQFVWLTVGGLGALWLQVLAFLAFLPWHSPAGAAAILFAIGGATFTTTREAPIGWRVARQL
jgi:hypothetical protein